MFVFTICFECTLRKSDSGKAEDAGVTARRHTLRLALAAAAIAGEDVAIVALFIWHVHDVVAARGRAGHHKHRRAPPQPQRRRAQSATVSPEASGTYPCVLSFSYTIFSEKLVYENSGCRRARNVSGGSA